MKRGVLRSLAVGIALGWVIAIAGSCGGKKTCGPDSCTGCCDVNGACQTGQLATDCGTAGAACSACTSGQTCSAGFCTGGGGGTDGGGGGGGAAFTQWCATFAETFCSSLVTCKSVDAADKTKCVNFMISLGCNQNADGIKKGYSTFDSTRAQQCMTDTQALATNCENSVPQSCNDLSTPAAALGGGCFSALDCTGTDVGCGGATCAKTCQNAGGLNQPCSNNYPSCDEGLWCDSQNGRVCKAPKSLGATCQSDDECGRTAAYCDSATKVCTALPGPNQPCYNNYYCAQGTYCQYSSNTCKTQPAIGQPCPDYNCVDAAYCDYVTSTGLTCVARKQNGDMCSSTNECLEASRCLSGTCQPRATEGQSCSTYLDCADGTSCDQVDRVCHAYAYGNAGAQCTGSTLQCNYPYNCTGASENPDGGVGTRGTCTAAALGDPCTSHYDCPEQAFCQKPDGGFDGVCATATVGSACSYDSNCPQNTYCDNNTDTCAARVGVGQQCLTSEDSCVAPYVCKGSGPTGTCGEPGGPNAPCLGGQQDCKTFYQCINNVCTGVGFQGQPCYSNLCFDGQCTGANPDAGTLGTCGAPAPDGTACYFGLQCQGKSCVDYQCQTCP